MFVRCCSVSALRMPSGWSELALQCMSGGTCTMTDAMETIRAQNPTISPPSIRIKNIPRNAETGTRFPKLGECAHFHYDMMDLATVQMLLVEPSKAHEEADKENQRHLTEDGKGCCCCWTVQVTSRDRSWTLRRTYDNFRLLDRQLHRCVYDRQFSKLPHLPPEPTTNDTQDEEEVRKLLTEYLQRFSSLVGNLLNCGSVLNWLELDNRGNRLLVTDESAINTPAVAAAYVTKGYQAQAPDEISFQVGDMVSVIDMPPADESTWWRGKKGFEVGFFPSECVQVIGDKIPHNLKIPTKPVLRRHGKLIAFFRSFLLSRPSRRKLKQSGILRERVFGCDLGEHLTNTGRDVPLVLTSCARFIEQCGIVDGIYRLSGVTSNIQKLRVTFDEDRVPDLNEDEIRQDIHCVASLLKMYFRELPNPLLTYQLYDKFVAAMQLQGNTRLLRIRDVVKELPPPHYRTLEALIRHLSTVSAHGDRTGMTAKNVAIVWAPNLLRSKDLEVASVGALHVIGVQAVLTEYLICYVDLIFNDKMPAYPSSPESLQSTPHRNSRPKSLAISTPTKLLSLEEARSRALASNIPGSQQQKYIDVGGGPESLPAKYHTVINFPPGKRGSGKQKKSPLGWKSFFVRGWNSGSAREKDKRSPGLWKMSAGSLPYHQSLPTQDKALTESDLVHSASKQLRSVKSAESLISSSDPSCRNSDALDSCNSSSDASRVQPFQWLPESTSTTTVPCGHKHVRSVSHDSYFECRGSGGLDLSLDDISTTYDLVTQHAAHSPTSPHQKLPRKQKLSSGSEGVNPKVQRLSDCKESANDLHDSQCSTDMQAKELVPFRDSGACTDSTRAKLHPAEELTDRLQGTGRSLMQFPNRQPLAIHSPDDIGPYQSPSPQEYVLMGCQYRNLPDRKDQAGEKTVLVEVHATEGDYTIKFHDEHDFVELRDETESDTKEGGLGPHLGLTSLAEDIASSLKMSNSEINTDFLVAVSERKEDCIEASDQLDATRTTHGTSFLNRLSAVLPYIEDTDTSPSGVSSPCVLGELLPPVTVSASSTPPYIEELDELQHAKDEQYAADDTALAAHESVIVRNVSFESLLLDSELQSVHLISETVKASDSKEVTESGCSRSDDHKGKALLLLDHKQQNSSSEDDETDTMPYAHLDESPTVEMLSQAPTPMPHSQSQDQNICLLSPADIAVQEDVLPSGIMDRLQSVSGLDWISDEVQDSLQGETEPHIMQALNDVISQDPLNDVCTHPEHHVATQRNEKLMELSDVDSDDSGNTDLMDNRMELTEGSPVQQYEGSSLENCKRLEDMCSDPSTQTCTHTHTQPGMQQMLLESYPLCSKAENPKQIESQEIMVANNTQSFKETFTTPHDMLCSIRTITYKEELTKPAKMRTSPTEEVQLRSSAMSASQLELKRKSEPLGSMKEPLCRRLSEPPASHQSQDRKGTVKELTSKFEGTEVSSASSTDISPKGSQPSLFTQMKVMRLLRNNPSSPSSSSGYDPWSDPILSNSDTEAQTANPVANDVVERRQAEPLIKDGRRNRDIVDTVPKMQERAAEDSKQRQGVTEVQKSQKVAAAKALALEANEAQRPATLDLKKVNAPTWVEPKVTDNSKEPAKLITSPNVDSETRRKRIEKIKEERRAQLREKLKSEGFRSDDRPEVTKQRRTLDCGAVAEKTENIMASSQGSKQSSEGDRESEAVNTSGGSMRQTLSLKDAENGKELPKAKKFPIKKTGGESAVLVRQMERPLAANQTMQAARVWEKWTTQQSKADGRPFYWSRADTGQQVAPGEQGQAHKERTENTSERRSQDTVLTSSKPPISRAVREPGVVSRNEDLSPPKRIRDRAAMFECRNQKEQHPPHRLARTDLPSC